MRILLLAEITLQIKYISSIKQFESLWNVKSNANISRHQMGSTASNSASSFARLAGSQHYCTVSNMYQLSKWCLQPFCLAQSSTQASTSCGLLYSMCVCSFYLFFNLLQAINSPDACKKRLVKYVVPVVLISILINVPKFLESQVIKGYGKIIFNFT